MKWLYDHYHMEWRAFDLYSLVKRRIVETSIVAGESKDTKSGRPMVQPHLCERGYGVVTK